MTGNITAFISVCVLMGLLALAPAAGAAVVLGANSMDIGKVIIISPGAGDTEAVNGVALAAALAGITDNADNNPYVIKLGPGTYDFGAGTLLMKEYVDIEGSGEKVTKITSTRATGWPPSAGTVTGVDNSEIRSLTVENTGVGSYNVAIVNSSASTALTHVTASSVGSGAAHSYIGVFNASSSAVINNVTASASGGSNNYSLYNYNSSSVKLNNVTASATGGTNATGIVNQNSPLTMTNIIASAKDATATNVGISNFMNSGVNSPTMVNVIATASGGTNSYGIKNDNSKAVMTNVDASASAATNTYGVYNTAPSPGAFFTVFADRCTFTGTYSILNNLQFTVRIGASKLNGAINGGIGSWTCAGSYDGSYAVLDDTCM